MEYQAKTIHQKYELLQNVGADGKGYLFVLQDESRHSYYAELLRIDNKYMSAETLYRTQLRMQRISAFTHTNTLTVFPPEICEEGLLLLQNNVTGASLESYLQKTGRPMPYETAISIAMDVITALAALHSEGIVHGSLNPSYILFDLSGKAYLSFLPLPPGFNQDRPVYNFMADGKEPAKRDDLYAFGLILTELFSSLPLYRPADPELSLEERIHIRNYYAEGLEQYADPKAQALLPIIFRCIIDNENSFQNAEEVYWALRHLVRDEDKPRENPVKVRSASRRQRPQTGSTEQNISASENKAFRIDSDKPKKKLGALPVILSGAIFLAAAVYLGINYKNKPVPTDLPEYRETLSILYVTQTALEEDMRIKQTSTAEPSATPTEIPTATTVPTETPKPLPIEEKKGAVVRWKADDSRMVYVPEGIFTMGMNDTFLYSLEGILPVHSVNLDAFWMDEREVTQQQYAACVEAGVCQPPIEAEALPQGEEFPVMNVRWDDAQAYCTWVGKRLPTEAEWEKAARSDDRRLYPWGNKTPIQTAETEIHAVGANVNDRSPYGVMDMGGNVSEWVSDFFSETRLIGDGELKNPIGPLTGNMHTVKGGHSGMDDRVLDAFVFRRWGSSPDVTSRYGFRCVASAADLDQAEMLSETADMAKALPYAPNPDDCKDMAGFVEDVTIPDGTPLKAGETVTKTWRLKNVGTCPWNENYKILYADENADTPQKMFDIGIHLEPEEEGEVSVTFTVRGEGGMKEAFLLANSDGKTFGLGERGKGELWMDYVVK